MAINTLEFFDFAKSLPEDEEIQRRTSISRAYYAAYHTCKLRYYPENSEEGGVHKKLISALIKSPNKKDKSIGYILMQLRGLREIADYDLDNDVDCNQRRTAILQTEILLEKLNML